MLGVADDGKAVGIEADNFQNEDKYLLHLMTAVKTTMGTNVAALVQPEYDVFSRGNGFVSSAAVKVASRSTYRRRAVMKRFFIRTGPSSAQLSPRELVSYMKDHFQI